jgi:hypothetical protein
MRPRQELAIALRIAALRQVAANTTWFFHNVQQATGLPPKRIRDEMQKILDRDAVLDPPALKRRKM